MIKDFFKTIEAENPAHYKKILKTLDEYDGQMERFADFFSYLEQYFKHIGFDGKKVADAYLFVVNKMLQHRLDFMRHDRYTLENEQQKENYDNQILMDKYMLGLVVSQYLWRHHIETFNFYLDNVKEIGEIDNLLEIGAGMGYYISIVLSKLNPKKINIVDISDNSINIAKELLKVNNQKYIDKIKFETMDINDYETDKKFNVIVMSGVLSCLNDPVKTLKVLNGLLEDNGKLFIFACANCPTPDHVFRFENPEHIRSIVTQGGFSIIKEKVSMSENLPLDKIKKFKLDIAHSLVLEKN